ncbi:hypothetical protein Hanom_Chr16g01469601 [Helianthus anomalus]
MVNIFSPTLVWKKNSGKNLVFLVTQFRLPLTNIFCGIQVKDEYGWRRFVLDGRRGFTDYSTIVPSGGRRSDFRSSGRAKGLVVVEWSTLATSPDITVIDTSFLVIEKRCMELYTLFPLGNKET